MRIRVGARPLVAVLGVFLLSGCHTYTPVDTAPLGSMVRIRVPLTSALTNGGFSETAAISGLLIESGDTLGLAVETRRDLGAYRELIRQDTVRLAADNTVSLELQEFSSGRTIALGVAIAGIVGTAAWVALDLAGGQAGDDPGPPGGPVTAVVSVPSIISGIVSLFGR